MRIEPTDYQKAKAASDYFNDISNLSYTFAFVHPVFGSLGVLSQALSHSVNPDKTSFLDEAGLVDNLGKELNNYAPRKW